MWKVSGLCMLLLALLQLTTSTSAQATVQVQLAQNSTNTSPNNTSNTSPPNPAAPSYSTVPANITVAVGESAVFRCGVSSALSKLTLTLYGSHGNHSLNCPGEPVDNIPQALHGRCKEKNGELLAVWTVSGTSYSDDSTRVVCQWSGHPDAPVAFLHVYDDGTNLAIIVGCTIGGFFGILLVLGLSYIMLQSSERLQRCFRGKESEDDIISIVGMD